ncbi:MAG TPA: aryl-sulfate sulfotransferase [Solirubrobacterales bacterium]
MPNGRSPRRPARLTAALLIVLMVPIGQLAFARAEGGAQSSRAGRSCLGRVATISRSKPGRVIVGTARGDVLIGGPGADRIRGKGGNDLICGGGGADRLTGGPGRDRLLGGAGADRLDGGPQADRCQGGAGRTLYKLCEQVPAGSRVHGPRSHRPGRRARGASGETELADGAELAVNDSAAMLEDAPPARIDVLRNDANVGGGDSPISFVSTPANGSAALTAGGTAVDYRPDPDYCSAAAPDRFSYGLSGGPRALVEVTVGCVDDPPVAVDDSAVVTSGSTPSTIRVLENDQDIDGGPKKIIAVSQPRHGSVSTGGATLAYRPDAGYCNSGGSPDEFTYELNGGSSATVTVSVECIAEVGGTPQLQPEFDRSISDYTVDCRGAPVSLYGSTPVGTSISIDGRPPIMGPFQASVPLLEDQEFNFSLEETGVERDYHVRCLPADFGIWEYTQLLPSRQSFYVVTPSIGGTPYAVIFDDHGVPVWWYKELPAPTDAKVLSDGTVAWCCSSGPLGPAYEIRSLDGGLLASIRATTGETDFHDFQQEPNGDYLLLTTPTREHVDTSAYGGAEDDSIVDAVVEEVNRHDELVWRWSAYDHLDLAETGRWWNVNTVRDGGDVFHINAVEPVGDNAVLVSMRHTDAIYKIDKATGDVLWKLGGTPTPESLEVINDPRGDYPFGGQHDVRRLEDGSITVHDNNTGLPNRPRAVRYRIDEDEGTATLIEAFNDPEAPSSGFVGSARRSPDGSWLICWGGNSLVTEFDAAHRRTFELRFGGIALSYRAVPVSAGVLSAAELRAGMDAMHPR